MIKELKQQRNRYLQESAWGSRGKRKQTSASLPGPLSIPTWDVEGEQEADSTRTYSSRWHSKGPVIHPTKEYGGTAAHFYFMKNTQSNWPKKEIRPGFWKAALSPSLRTALPAEGTTYRTFGASASPRNRTFMGYGTNCVWQSLKMCELFLGKKAVISGYTQKNKRQCHHSKAKKKAF